MSSPTYSVNIGGSQSLSPNGTPWTPSTLANTQVGVNATVPAGGTVSIRSMALQVKVAAIPVVKSIGFAPNSNMEFGEGMVNSIDWEYYDPNNAPQSYWQVKVFDVYTKTLDGFSPDTSTPIFESSGNDKGSGVTLSEKTGYKDGEQYWAFVRVGKKVNNQTVYSKWKSAFFTVTIEQPQPPLIAVEKDETNAVNRLQIQSSDNLFSENNADFRSGTGAWNKTAADTASTTLAVAETTITTGTALTAGTIYTSLPVGTKGTLASAIGSSGLGTFKVTGTTNPGSTSHVAFTGNTTNNSNIITNVSSLTGIITGMVVFGAGIPSGAVITGTTGGGSPTITLSQKATATASSVSLIANFYNAADALGFPRSGQFWVTIGTEKLLVKNTMDGDNTGDTFTILQRGYLGSSAASHSIGSQITYGLQNDVYAGSIGTITQAYQASEFVKSALKHRPLTGAAARGASGSAGSVTPGTPVNLTITRGTNGTNYSQMDRIYVNDPSGILKAGQQVTINYKFVNISHIKVGNVTGSGNNYANTTRKSKTLPNRPGANSLPVETATIKSVEDAVPETSTEYLVGKFSNKYGGQCGQTGPKTIRVETDEKMNGSGAKVKVLKAGTVVRINMNGSNNYKLPNGDHVNSQHSGDKNLYLRLTQDTDLTPGTIDAYGRYFCSIHVDPIKNGGDFNYTSQGVKLWYIPDGARIYYSVKDQPKSTEKKVTFTSTLMKGKWVGQQVHKGDILTVTQPARSNPGSGTGAKKAVTQGVGQPYYDYTVNKTAIHNSQSFTVDFNGAATQLTSGTLGYMVGATFTAMNSAGTINGGVFTTLRFTATATLNQYQGYSITGDGIPVGATVASNTATSSGTFRITLSSSGNQVYNGTNYYTTGDFELFPPGSGVISAGSTSIPVAPFTANANYLNYSLTSFHYPTRFGENVMLVDPTANGTVDISIYPTGSWKDWSNNNQSASVNAGGTYGFAGFTKVVAGGTSSPYPTLAYYIDWYDEFGNLLKSSDGTESLSGTVHSFTPSRVIGQSTTSGDSWTPNAIVAKAPLDQVLASTATYSAGTTTSGTYSITGGTLAISLKAGTYIYTDRWAVLTSAASAGATSVNVRFPLTDPPSNGSVSALTISATRACPRIRITNAKTADTYAVSALMFRSLNVVPSGTFYDLNTNIPELSVATNTSSDITGASTFVMPATTDTSGADSLYLFDPTNDHATREIHEGAGSPATWTALSVSAGAGDTNIILNSVLGLGVNGLLIIGKGSSLEETVTISNTWSGSNVVSLQSPLWYSHGAGSTVYAQTNQILDTFSVQQAIGTPVAVFNWNNDGYINSPNTAYVYRVEKSDDYGNTWQVLYGGDALRADSSGLAAITDFEVIPNALTYYRATPYFINKNSVVTAGVSTPPMLAEVLNSDTWWLSSSSDETIRFPVLIQNGIQETQRHPAGIFYPIGSSRPIVTAGVVTGRDASVSIIWTDDANWQNFIAMLNMGETLVLINPVESERRYIFISGDVSYTHHAAAKPWREVSFPFVEVAPPRGFGYTYGS